MSDDSAKISGYQLLQYLACYALWIGLSALGFSIFIQLRHDIVTLAMLVRVGPRVVVIADKGGVLLLGMFWLGGIIALEAYLRKGVSNGLLWGRAFRIVLLEAIALGIAYGLRLLLT